MLELKELIVTNVDWLIENVLHHTTKRGYTAYTLTLEEMWRNLVMSISQELTDALNNKNWSLELELKEHLQIEGSIWEIFKLLMYYRSSCLELIMKSDLKNKDHFVSFIHDFLDSIEMKVLLEVESALKKKSPSSTSENIKYMTIYESIPTPVFLLNEEGFLALANSAAIEFLVNAYTIKDYHNKSSEYIRIPYIDKEVTQFIEDKIHEQKFEKEIETSHGHSYFEIRFKRIPNSILVLFYDITESKELENKYRSLFNNVNDAVFVYEFTNDGTLGKFIEVNDVACEMLGYTKEHFLSMTLLDLFSKEYLEQIPFINQKLLEKRQITIEIEQIAKDGSKIPVEVSAHLFNINDNAVVLSIARDISRRKAAREIRRRREEEFRALVENAPDIIARFDKNVRFVYVNKAVENELGVSIQEVIGKTHEEIELLKDKAYIWDNALKRVFRNGTEERLYLDLMTPKGRKYYYFRIVPEFAIDGSVENALNIARDITEQKKTQKELHDIKERLRITLLSIGDAVISTDIHGKVTFMNNVAEKLTGWKEEEAIGRLLSDVLVIINEETRIKVTSPVDMVLAKGHTAGLANHTLLISKYGNEIAIADSAAPIKDGNGVIQGVVIVFRDITDEAKIQKEIEYLTFHDKLTGLYNRAYFEEILARLDTEMQLPLSLIMGDLNGLKLVNDALGHHEGDKLLIRMAKYLKDSCRNEDIIARWGGDEFVIVLPRTSEEVAMRICDRIRNNCDKYHENELIQLSIALGHATKEDPKEDIEKVLLKAEGRMYRNKFRESNSIRNAMISSLKRSLFETNYETEEHTRRLEELSLNMGKALQLSDSQLDELTLLASLHDIGKIAIPNEILMKKGKLLRKEWDILRKHPEIGYRIASASSELAPIANTIFSHHEWWDGSGYPQGLKGEEIPLISRIVAIIDAYDAMTNDRPYRKAISHEEATEELRRCAGTQFDPKLVEFFIEMHEENLEIHSEDKRG